MRRIHYVTGDGDHAAGANVTVSDEQASAAIASGTAVSNDAGVWGPDDVEFPAGPSAAAEIEQLDEDDLS